MAAAKVAAPKISPVRLEELRDDDAPDFRRGERYDGDHMGTQTGT